MPRHYTDPGFDARANTDTGSELLLCLPEGYTFVLLGAVAQLAEHRFCKAGVRGSNPLSSTRKMTPSFGVIFFFWGHFLRGAFGFELITRNVGFFVLVNQNKRVLSSSIWPLTKRWGLTAFAGAGLARGPLL